MTKRPRPAFVALDLRRSAALDLRHVRGGDGVRLHLDNKSINAGMQESSQKT
jgi:hypothetical protein